MSILRVLFFLLFIPAAVWPFFFTSKGSSSKEISLLEDGEESPEENQKSLLRASRMLIYQETEKACKQGYYYFESRKVDFNEALKKQMIEETSSCSMQEPLSLLKNASYSTLVEVVEEDTFDLLFKYQQEGLHPVGLNMANSHKPGGGVRRGAAAQEESLFRRSNYHLALCSQRESFYPIPEAHAIYTPYVQVFREKETMISPNKLSCSYLEKPFIVDLIACPFYSLRGREAPENYESGTRDKIRNILRVAYMTGHDTLVLGAAGCGSFANDPRLIARWFQEELNSPEFKGCFIKVGFGILHPEIRYRNREENREERFNLIQVFKEAFGLSE